MAQCVQPNVLRWSTYILDVLCYIFVVHSGDKVVCRVAL